MEGRRPERKTRIFQLSQANPKKKKTLKGEQGKGENQPNEIKKKEEKIFWSRVGFGFKF